MTRRAIIKMRRKKSFTNAIQSSIKKMQWANNNNRRNIRKKLIRKWNKLKWINIKS